MVSQRGKVAPPAAAAHKPFCINHLEMKCCSGTQKSAFLIELVECDTPCRATSPDRQFGVALVPRKVRKVTVCAPNGETPSPGAKPTSKTVVLRRQLP